MENDVSGRHSVEGDFIRQEEIELVQDLISELPDRLRIPLILYYTLEMKISEIASMLDLPQGTVKSRLHAARHEVKKGFLSYE
jgi:RNA polymerase sigma-70 factor (ECF subfamily)